jgi:hypothetical protein
MRARYPDAEGFSEGDGPARSWQRGSRFPQDVRQPVLAG